MTDKELINTSSGKNINKKVSLSSDFTTQVQSEGSKQNTSGHAINPGLSATSREHHRLSVRRSMDSFSSKKGDRGNMNSLKKVGELLFLGIAQQPWAPGLCVCLINNVLAARSLNRSSETLTGHALKEVMSDYIMAGPHSTLLTVQSSSIDQLSFISSHYLRRHQRDGYDVPMDFDDAIAETGHGRFQYKLMALCGFIYACCSLSTTTLSFVLPAAQFDFHFSSVDKGLLNTAPLWGMVAGAYIWGNFADTKGRRFVLMWSLFIDAFAAFISSFCQTYTLFFICRIFNGFGIIGATSMVFAYLGEFIDCRRRDRYLSRLELFWTFGIIALPVIGFVILPRDWQFGSSDGFHYNSWRMFVLACGVPSLLAAVLIARMPESPRFLLLQGHHDKTREVLIKMFVSNTKNPAEEFPVKVLNESNEADAYYFPKLKGLSCWVRFKNLMAGLGKQHRDLLWGRSLFNIILTCVIDFGIMSVYYTIMLWVPELLHRQETYLKLHPNKTTATLCEVNLEEFEETGDGKVHFTTFIHTFIVCFACLPSNIILLLIISYVSKKALLAGIMICASLPTVAVYYMDTEFKVTTMLCLFEALTTLIEAVLFCAIVEIFPLSTRGTALSLTVTIGRLGAVLGNIAFGVMIDNNCTHLFFGMASILVLSGLAALFLPKMRTGHGGGSGDVT